MTLIDALTRLEFRTRALGNRTDADAIHRARTELEAYRSLGHKYSDVFGLVLTELSRATQRHGPIRTQHHGYAVIKEELDEVWDKIKANNHDGAVEEAVHVAAMAFRFVLDLQGGTNVGDT